MSKPIFMPVIRNFFLASYARWACLR